MCGINNVVCDITISWTKLVKNYTNSYLYRFMYVLYTQIHTYMYIIHLDTPRTVDNKE